MTLMKIFTVLYSLEGFNSIDLMRCIVSYRIYANDKTPFG